MASGRVEAGFDPARFPECEDRLQSMLRDLHADVQTLDVDGVAAAVQMVSTVSPEECGGDVGHHWKLFPGKETRPGCPAAASTGALDDGGLVVTWRPGYDDAVCWVMSTEGEWAAYGSPADGPPGTEVIITGPLPSGAVSTVEVISYDVPDLEGWFDPNEAIPFHRDSGSGDHTAQAVRSSHPYAALFYEGDDPVAVVNFSEGTMQPALARRLAAAAVESQPALGDLNRRMEIHFQDNVAWEIREQDVPVINLWLTYEVWGDNLRS